MLVTELDDPSAIEYKYLENQYLKCNSIAPDDKFVNYLAFL